MVVSAEVLWQERARGRNQRMIGVQRPCPVVPSMGWQICARQLTSHGGCTPLTPLLLWLLRLNHDWLFHTLYDDRNLSEDAVPSGIALSKRHEQINDTDDVLDASDGIASSICIKPLRSPSASSTTELEGDSVSLLDEHQVLSVFRRCKFPIEGIVANNIDGLALLSLYADADAEDMSTKPAPGRLGFQQGTFEWPFSEWNGQALVCVPLFWPRLNILSAHGNLSLVRLIHSPAPMYIPLLGAPEHPVCTWKPRYVYM